MTKLAIRKQIYNGGLPLFDWAFRTTLYRRTPAGKRLERLYGLSPHAAEAIAPLAGLGEREGR